MAKRKGSGRKKAANGEAGIGHNFKVDRKSLKNYFDRQDRLDDQKADIKAKASEKCGEISGDIRALVEDACNDLGCSKAVYKQIRKEHDAERDRVRRLAAMDETDRDQADKLRLALGSYASTPLGKAAVDKKEIAAAEAEVSQ